MQPEQRSGFTDTGMELGETVVEYAALDSVIATEDIYMFVWDGKVTVLQKRDLDGGDADFDGVPARKDRGHGCGIGRERLTPWGRMRYSGMQKEEGRCPPPLMRYDVHLPR